MSKTDTTRMSISLPEALWERIKSHQHRTGALTTAEAVRRLLLAALGAAEDRAPPNMAPISSLAALREKLAAIPSQAARNEMERLWRRGRHDEAIMRVERLTARAIEDEL